MKENNLILDKSLSFAVRIVNLYKHLKKIDERILATQILKSGTSIGANTREAMRAQSRNDFLSKMNIALKEAYETEYWIELLHRTDYITQKEFDSIFSECRELTNILSKIIITTKERS
ncbi:MAG: four helix bundle protein [Rikenellaceae bacterium]|nr:four helix bundle protein [Rikenellaceae bacterium]MBR5844706.1 four helix bundle protein [Rikenellaceae bacterium]